MRKTRIEVKTNLVAHAKACEITKLVIYYWCDISFDITDYSKNKANINFANINLVKFGIYTKILLINNVKKTCHR